MHFHCLSGIWQASNRFGKSAEGAAPSAALRTQRETLASLGTHHPTVGLIQTVLSFSKIHPPLWIDPQIQQDNQLPSLQHHYSTFITTAKSSAPVPRISTRTLAGSLLEVLPLHRDDRFSRSTPKPMLSSRLLHAGCRPGSQQYASRTHPDATGLASVLTSPRPYDSSSKVHLRSSP